MSSELVLRDVAGLGELVLRWGREGWSRAEIAGALGLMPAELAAWEAEDATLAEALMRARAAALAWWEGAPRAALEVNARFDRAAWMLGFEARFPGEALPPTMRRLANARAALPLEAPTATRDTVVIEIPENGRELGPDGRMLADNPDWLRSRDRAEAERDIRRARAGIAELTAELEAALERQKEIETHDYEAECEGWDDDDDGWDEDNGDGDDGRGDEGGSSDDR